VSSKRDSPGARPPPTGRNVAWQHGQVARQQREKLLGQHGCMVWLTGLSGAGKSTLARGLEERLTGEGRLCYVLDGDNVRHGLCRDLGFSAEDRHENIRRVAELGALMVDAGLIVISAFISPYRVDRDYARARVPAERFLEVFLDVPLTVCEARDPKGLYKKARAGEIKGFTGIDDPYEAPESAEIRLDTAAWSVEECVERMLGALRGGEATPN